MDEAMKRVAANICQSAALCDDTQSDKLIFHYQQNEVRFYLSEKKSVGCSPCSFFCQDSVLKTGTIRFCIWRSMDYSRVTEDSFSLTSSRCLVYANSCIR